jgi:predicted DNA-binding transcriptional regulator AlpA
MSSDPLAAAIAAAVDRAFEARLPQIVAALKAALPKPPSEFDDRFVPMHELVELLRADRSTIHRRAKRGNYPPLRKQGGSVGYYLSDLRGIFTKPEKAKR